MLWIEISLTDRDSHAFSIEHMRLRPTTMCVCRPYPLLLIPNALFRWIEFSCSDLKYSVACFSPFLPALSLPTYTHTHTLPSSLHIPNLHASVYLCVGIFSPYLMRLHIDKYTNIFCWRNIYHSVAHSFSNASNMDFDRGYAEWEFLCVCFVLIFLFLMVLVSLAAHVIGGVRSVIK